MYLIAIEGGDGSGKGLATKMIEEICLAEFTFAGVDVTGEPRRNHPLGQLAVDAVRTGEAGPVHEASMFAADRLDHSHAWIIPRLSKGHVVISERNIHSSLVYQGIVGDLGLEEVARLNAAACVPDLSIWVDCDPEVALRRISEGTLRLETLDKQEYFETDELQVQIREGYRQLLGGEIEMPEPFHTGEVAGPVVNDGSKADLKAKLQRVLRAFLHRRPLPLNVDAEAVEQHMLKSALRGQKGQLTLDVMDSPPQRSNHDWLNDEAPWRVIKNGHALYLEARAGIEDDRSMDVPQNPLHHTVLSVVGTLSLLSGAEVSGLRKWLGPVRMVTSRHTQRTLKFLHEQSGWVRVHRPLSGRDAPRSELRADWQAYGRLGLVIWPFKEEFAQWRADNPDGRWRDSMSAILGRSPSEEMQKAVASACARLEVLGSGKEGVDPPNDLDAFRNWWRSGPE